MEFSVLQKDLIAAMKAKDKLRKDTLSSMVAAVKKLAIDEGKRDNIPDELVDRAILKEIKTAREQVDTCPAAREDLIAEYSGRLKIIEEYAPKMLSADEVKTLICEKYADAVAGKNKGQIMKAVMADLKGKADGKVISGVVDELCR